MATETPAKEKLQLYLRTDQVSRLHLLKGQTREPISGMVEHALEDYFARLDRNQSKPDALAASA